MSLSGNKRVPKQTPIKMSKPNGHSGGPIERNGNNFLKLSINSRPITQEFKDGYDAIDWSKK